MSHQEILTITKIGIGQYECTVNLDKVFDTTTERDKFEGKWDQFITSDEWNGRILTKHGNFIRYPHKSWLPQKDTDRTKLLIIGGNPAPHSVYEDIYFAFEVGGGEHRFWKVFRELGFIDLPFEPSKMKENFLQVKYESPFVVGLEAVFTFPSSASAPKWSGVQGIQKLFGTNAFLKLYRAELTRVHTFARDFFGSNTGAILAMQKHAYEAFATNPYAIKQAVTGDLASYFDQNIKIYGTPPTRWLYTQKMQAALKKVKADILNEE